MEEIITAKDAVLEQDMHGDISTLEIRVNSIAVTDQPSYEIAAELTRQIKSMQKRVVAFWEPMRLSAKEAYDSVLAHKKAMTAPLEKAESILKRKMSTYLVELEEERRRKETEAKRMAEEEARRKLEEAVKADEQGDSVTAEVAMMEAEIMESASKNITITAEKVKAEGVTATKSWEITGINMAEVPIDINGVVIRPVDEKAVLRLIKASKGTIKIPGVSYKETYSMSARA